MNGDGSRAGAGLSRGGSDTGGASSGGPTGAGKRRGATDREHAIMSELLSTIGDVNELGRPPSRPPHAMDAAPPTTKRQRVNGSARRDPAKLDDVDFAAVSDAESSDDDPVKPHDDRPRRATSRDNSRHGGGGGDEDDEDDDDTGEHQSDRSSNAGQSSSVASRHTRLTELEQQVRELERENLHLKQTLLLGKGGSVMLPGARSPHENTQQLLGERTRVVQEMVDLLNAPFLSLSEAARVWHDECRVGVGVREWDAFGRLATISLWNMIRSVFANIAVDIVELRPHLPDGEMILTKWRIQGEIAPATQLTAVRSSEDCPETMKVAVQAIKSSDLTFTVTTYIIFQDVQIAEQHHCWDQVGVFKRLFGGEIPPSVQQMLTIPDGLEIDPHYVPPPMSAHAAADEDADADAEDGHSGREDGEEEANDEEESDDEDAAGFQSD
ncbi:hypothetical protein P43SY_008953 [Pythium insidiosum]|uniref:Uncharacterized protein n=1 Tax=Pythium insidiosum TaxID=114742 RepID=A0AAD5QCF4_PYTIN|nr:hypothetical protein P43SY_008953 [Pythium insidiosum]